MAPFTGPSPRLFGALVASLRYEGADAVRRGRPWSLPLEDCVLPAADADTCLVVTGNRNDCGAWEKSGAKAAVGRAATIANGAYRGTGLVTEGLAVGSAGPDPTASPVIDSRLSRSVGVRRITCRGTSRQLVDVSTRKTPPCPAFPQVRGVI
jgi:hypothetical protein